MSQFKSIILAFRPKTLTAALVPILVSVGYVQHQVGTWQGWVLFCLLASAFAIQIATNLFNDAVDFKKGADGPRRLGPQRITQAGVLSYQQVIALALGFVFIALAFGTPLVLQGGWPIILIGVVSLFFAYGYTGGPFPLAYLGLGDLFVLIFFGLIAVGGSVFLLAGQWMPVAFVLGIQVGLHATNLITINNMRDAAQDILVDKKTLAVRLGLNRSRYQILVMTLLPFFLTSFWLWHLTLKILVFLPLLSLPLAFKLIKNIFLTEPSEVYNQFLAKAAGLHLVFGFLTMMSFLLDAILR